MSVPSLQDLLYDKSKDKFFNRSNFTRYLASIHCLENFDFLLDVNKYYKLSNDRDRIGKWNQVIKLYLLPDSMKEINIPHQIRNSLLTKDHLPPMESIKKAYKIVSELVLDNYNQFIGMVKRQQQSKAAQTQPPVVEVTRKNSTVERRGSTTERRGSTTERRGSSSTSRRSSVVEIKSTSRRGSSSTSQNSGHLSTLLYGSNNSSNSSHNSNNNPSRRPSIIEYPKSPINNGTSKPVTITKLPSPQSDIEGKKSKNSGMFKMKKFKFRRNSNEN